VHEEYCFLDLRGERIFAGHHRPARPASQAIVMCHPLGEEKLWSHRVFVSFARELAAAGFAVLRFDFRGEGDSDRTFERSDFESRIQDACLAVETVRALNPAVTKVTLIGLRLGASVAAAAAARRSDVAQIVLWDPVLDGAAYMQTVLRLNLMFQMAIHRRVVKGREALAMDLADGGTVNIEGYQLAAPLFRQVSEFRMDDVLCNFAGEILFVSINQGEMPVPSSLIALAENFNRRRVEVVREDAFWREIKTFYQRAPELTRVTLQALRN
jgi:exosortase A-associated hydrolase 2